MKKYSSVLIFLFCICIVAVLIKIPTGFEGALQFKDAEKCRVLVEEADNSRLIDTGLIRSGQQICRVKILSGKFKGLQAEGWNMLGGSLSQDKLFRSGDKVQAIIHYGEGENGTGFYSVNLIDYYRLNWELILAVAFGIFLIAFAGTTGIRSVFSFAITILVLRKVLVPLYLNGVIPILTGILVVGIMTFVILALVYGFDRQPFRHRQLVGFNRRSAQTGRKIRTTERV